MKDNETRNIFYEAKKQALEIEKTRKRLLAQVPRTWMHWYGLFYALEVVQLDKSAWTYKKLRETLPFYLDSDDELPKELREFINNELTRDNPFYPDKGKHSSEVIMQRALEIGYEIEETKELNSRRSIYQQIIPKIAKELGIKEATVKKNYEQKFLPIFKEASEKAARSAARYQAMLDDDAKFREWLIKNP